MLCKTDASGHRHYSRVVTYAVGEAHVVPCSCGSTEGRFVRDGKKTRWFLTCSKCGKSAKPPDPLYLYRWGNNAKRKTMKGRRCRILHRMSLNSCMVEFLDNGQRETVSRNALRKTTEETGND